MKRLTITRFILYSIVFITVNVFIFSCINQEKENNDSLKTEYTTAESPIDFNLIDCLNESNKKNIDISSIAFHQTKNVRTLQLLLKIKRDHQKIDRRLKKLTEKNLIIIPKLAYNLNIDSGPLKGEDTNYQLLSLLETEIKNQLKIFNEIEKTTQNTDFKIFAVQSQKTLRANIDLLNNI